MTEQVTQKIQDKKPKGSFRCPKELAELIELVNELPVAGAEYIETLVRNNKIRLRQFYEGCQIFDHDRRGLGVIMDSVEMEPIMDKKLWKELEMDSVLGNPKISEFLLRKSRWVNPVTWAEKRYRYISLVRDRKILLGIAEYATGLTDWDIDYFIYNVLSVFPSNDYNSATRKEKDLLELKFSGVLRLILNEKIYLSNIRKCSICEKVFFAKREISVTCSPTCLSTLTTRNYRKKLNKDEINEQRRNNHLYNSKLKKSNNQSTS